MSNSLTRDRTSGKSHIEQHLRAQLELLQNHDGDASASPGSRDSRGALAHSPSSQGANGYEDLAAVSHEAVRALGKTQVEAHIHPDLRGLSEQSPPDMMSISPAPGHSPSTSPTALSSASMAPAPSSSAADVRAAVEGPKAKRELSQSKRAAQNRAAQSENFALRGYVMSLQARLLDLQGDYPPPPPNINLTQSPGAQQQPGALTAASAGAAGQVSDAASSVSVVTSLEAVAQAVAAEEQLAQSQHQEQQQQQQQQQREQSQTYPSPNYRPESREEDSRTAEEINRQFQEDHQQGASAQPAET
ncbi:transmembrane protein [Moelleriella libera RCEF 2490]|uniref:Transmembrane protein n=1 Tax=Moelleriella libera RCEF 2490 TaxID=1081109 RepID=A0A167XT37_9HYPO|nr:transmembrane protein [Moelleriella libera RCEF 2490]